MPEQGDPAGEAPSVSAAAVSAAAPRRRVGRRDQPGASRRVLLREEIRGNAGPHGAVRRPLLPRASTVSAVTATARSIAAAAAGPTGSRRRNCWGAGVGITMVVISRLK